MRAWALAAVLLAARASAAPPLLAPRVIVHTDAGDIALALYADAPRHAGKLLALFRAGAYDGSPFAKIDASRFAAVSSARRAPGAARLPLENGGAPREGVVMMAHQPGDADPGETAFVILFADLPAMAGRFSSVGEITGGREVLEALRRAPVDGDSRPVHPLTITGTTVVAGEADLAKASLRGPVLKALGWDEDAARRHWLQLAAAMGLATAAALWLLGAELGPASASVALLAALAGFFCLFAVYADKAAASPWISVPLFAATVAVFRLMSRFER